MFRRLIALLAALAGASCTLSGPSLPEKTDLTQRAGFPPVMAQQGNSCAAQAALYYTSGQGDGEGRAGPLLSPYQAYAILARGRNEGVHLADTWLLARETGIPLLADAPRYTGALMHGFEKYRRALQHRPAFWRYLPLTESAHLNAVKAALAEGKTVACDFQVRGVRPLRLPAGHSRAGEAFVPAWGRTGPGHVMVYAGYDDAFAFDYNRDGRITTDVDITGDRRVTLADCERGAFLLLNPWGPRWGVKGRAWAPYREHAASLWPRAHEVAVLDRMESRIPRMLRLSVQVQERSDCILTVGAGPRGAAAPSRTLQPLPFRHEPVPHTDRGSVLEEFATLCRPGPHISPGPLAAPGGGAIEMGFDLTGLDGETWFLTLTSASGRPLRGVISAASIVEPNDAISLLINGQSAPSATSFSGLPAALDSPRHEFRTR